MPKSPIHEIHERLGARFTDFGGWDMPVQYDGVIAEHTAVRTGVGLFDVSHLGRFELVGEGATELLRRELCNDVGTIEPGRAQYTMALDDDGGVVDDIIVLRLDSEHFWVLPNGVNYDLVADRFGLHLGSRIRLDRRREDTAFFALQGPRAMDVLEDVAGIRTGRFRVEVVEIGGAAAVVAGTGYTGERGCEIAVPAVAAADLFEALLDAGATVCGLGARDTLRLEMGYPLWGQDLSTEITPLEAGLGWVVDWEHDFVGRSALIRQRDDGLSQSLVAFATEGRLIARNGHRLRAGDASGVVTSGNFSPTLGHGIAMGYLAPPSTADRLEVEIRGKWVAVDRTSLPFYEK